MYELPDAPCDERAWRGAILGLVPLVAVALVVRGLLVGQHVKLGDAFWRGVAADGVDVVVDVAPRVGVLERVVDGLEAERTVGLASRYGCAVTVADGGITRHRTDLAIRDVSGRRVGHT